MFEDERERQLHEVYINKARQVDQEFRGGQPGIVVWAVERKLVAFPQVEARREVK